MTETPSVQADGVFASPHPRVPALSALSALYQRPTGRAELSD
jgi:hypothetical protein